MTETCQAKFPGVARDCCGQWNPRRKQLMFSTGELAQMADLSALPRGIRPNELEAFAALVAERAAAAEREWLVEKAESSLNSLDETCSWAAAGYAQGIRDFVAAIRARSMA